MRILRPFYEILSGIDREKILCNIEKYGRTCYKSEHFITEGSASEFVRKIINSGHLSVIEHESITVKFVCDRGVSHELVRHRLASYSQESTRYCNYSKDKFNNQLTFILPCWFQQVKEGEYSDISFFYNNKANFSDFLNSEYLWFISMLNIEANYKQLIDNGWSPQQARSILPNSLKTEVVMTCNLREWRHVLELRTSYRAHPQIREIGILLLKEFQNRLPEIFENVEEKRL